MPRRFLPILWFALTAQHAGAAAPSVISVRWDELAAQVSGKTVTVGMPDGAILSGRAQAVEADALVLQIRHTTNRATYPKGEYRVLRAGVRAIQVSRKTARWRIVGTTLGAMVGVVAGAFAAIGANGGLFGNHGDRAVVTFAAVSGGVTVGGYFIGNAADRHTVTLLIQP
jgi:hypothetical protein